MRAREKENAVMATLSDKRLLDMGEFCVYTGPLYHPISKILHCFCMLDNVVCTIQTKRCQVIFYFFKRSFLRQN